MIVSIYSGAVVETETNRHDRMMQHFNHVSVKSIFSHLRLRHPQFKFGMIDYVCHVTQFALIGRSARSQGDSDVISFRIYAEWFFYQHDAMLARVLAVVLCLSVSVSVTSRCSIETVERIRLVFGAGASFHLSYIVLQGNWGIFKTKGIHSSGTLLQTLDFQKISPQYIDRRNVL